MFPSGGPNPTAESMNYTVVINSAVWGGALLYYFVDARKWFTGPKTTVESQVLTLEQQAVMAAEGGSLTVGEDVSPGNAHVKGVKEPSGEKNESGVNSA